ncbi:hypothetical protein DL769_002685 [Monosporascus sp. CRB-8-3]|nr:hypothetical protein DL769_002685 [Monosporascus sp. CRB-8-3]
MERGLDELIESLLTEIAFSGSRGCSALDLVKAIDSFYNRKSTDSGPSTEAVQQTQGTQTVSANGTNSDVNGDDKSSVETADLELASKVWGWLVARHDVSVGTNREFNHLSLEEILDRCEREKASSVTADSQAVGSQQVPSSQNPKNPETASESVGPRLYVSEERQWKTLTGHGPDFKRIPLFEWKALVDIASVKQNGILQGDLVRLTGQDKRSLPTRTDALAKKGYIIKQPILLRGFRSSKIWLKQFAESAQAEARREGLPLEELDLSRESLMRDLDPVPFHTYWNGDKIDYLAIAQGFLAITKAWGIIRYCDLRTKMGVDERVPQMRALAKSSRWFTKLGAVTFVAARFANSSRLFKDCVKFLRDPTPSEWKQFRKIPTNHIKAPSSRIGKRGQASRDHAKLKAKKAETSHGGQQAKSLPAAKAHNELLDQIEVTSSSWMPQKPFVNTVFDIIRRAGSEGSSNNDIRHQTLGYRYRKFIASLNASLSSPLVQVEQPEFQVISQLTRVGKTTAYQFFAPGYIDSATNSEETSRHQDQEVQTKQPTIDSSSQGFSEPDPSKFATNGSVSLTQLCNPPSSSSKSGYNQKRKGFIKERASLGGKSEPKRDRGRPPKRAQATDSLDVHLGESQADSPIGNLPNEISAGRERRAPGHPEKKVQATEPMVDIADDTHLRDLVQSPSHEDNDTIATERDPPLPRAPGVYRGLANSLDPEKKMGRPRKSVVLIFRSDKLKDPTFLGAGQGTFYETRFFVGPPEEGISGAAVPASAPPPPVAGDESLASPELDQAPVARSSFTPRKGSNSSSRKGHRCEKCGKSWKNPNGLEYHLNKSQTPCNPLFVPQVRAPAPARKKALPVPYSNSTPRPLGIVDRKGKSAQPAQSPTPRRLSTGAPGNTSAVQKPHSERAPPEESSFAAVPNTPSKLGEGGLSIVLQDVEVYNVTSRFRGHRRSASQHSEGSIPQPPQKRQKISGDKSTAPDNIGEDMQPRQHQEILQGGPISEGRDAEPREPHERPNVSEDNAKSSREAKSCELPQKRQLVSGIHAGAPGGETELGSPRKRRMLSQHITMKLDEVGRQEQPTEQAMPADQDELPSGPPILLARTDKSSDLGGTMRRNFILRPTLAEPSDAVHTSKESFLSITSETSNQELLINTTNASDDHPGLQKPNQRHVVDQFSAPTQPKPLFHSSIPNQKALSEGGLRRERTIEIVLYLLDNNDGVFPGELSLYIVVASIWARMYSDIKPPDRKTVQSAVNRMEKQGKLKQLHFFFLDKKGNSQGICVLVKVSSGDNRAEELSSDPRVVDVKEKVRETYPDTYIPPAFPLSQQESELYRALLSKYREPSKRSGYVDSATKSLSAHEVEVLHYPRPVMSGVLASEESFVPGPMTDEDYNANPVERSRGGISASTAPGHVSLKDTPKPQGVRKPRKRAPLREYWDTGKMATYIWSQKHSSGATWDQRPTYLQDPATGAWSSAPQILVSSQASIDKILSLVKVGKAAKTKGPGRRRKDLGIAIPPLKKMRTYNTLKRKAYEDSMGDVDETNRRAPTTDVIATIGRIAEDPFMQPSTVASFNHSSSAHDGDDSDDGEDDTVMSSSQGASILDEDSDAETSVRFGQIQEIKPIGEGYWPCLRNDFFRSKKTSFSLNGSMPTARWFHHENLPHSVDDVLNVARGQIRTSFWADKQYAEFVRRVNAVRNWEVSNDGSHLLLMAKILPGSIFLDFCIDESKADMRPVVIQWPDDIQYTIDNLPKEIRYGRHDDQDAGLSDAGEIHVRLIKPRGPYHKKNQELRDQYAVKPQSGAVQASYKTRTLVDLPPSQQGRVGKRRLPDDMLGLSGDTALITAFVVIKSLIGGVEGTIDYGLILKLFPERSYTSLKNFWPKACKQRKRFVNALTEKFQSSFLEAYEKGDLPPLDYDNPEDYNWVSLIRWAMKLDIHEDVYLPESRNELDRMYSLEDPDDEVVDWREIWFANVAVHTRIEANISKPSTIPIHQSQSEDILMMCARSWIRSLCSTSLTESGAPNKVISKILELGNGSEEQTSKIFGKVITRLVKEKIATKGKSKKFGFRLNYNVDKIVEKSANVEKYIQAVTFKTKLDEAFHNHGEMFLPYASNDGSIMATLNLQSYGRIRMEPVDVPHIPFGFEPGNYEGRSYPKSYYHWKVRLVPTEKYLYDHDMPLLDQVQSADIPTKGPHGAIPIWVDLLDKVDKKRWVEYVCMLAFALATKGPLTPSSASVILKPVLEPFEAELIMDFLDRLGLLHRLFPGSPGGTVGEWWWLAVGKLIDVKGKGVARGAPALESR